MLTRDQIFEGENNYIRISNKSIETKARDDIFVKIQNKDRKSDV